MTVYSELIVIIMTGTEASAENWRELERSYGGQLLRLSDVLLVYRNTNAELLIQAPRQEPVGLPKNDSQLAVAFAAVIFGDSEGESCRRLVEVGLDPHFLTDVNQALKRDSSAYLIYVPQESMIDTRRYLEMLGQLQGDIYHTIFRSQVEEALMKKDN